MLRNNVNISNTNIALKNRKPSIYRVLIEVIPLLTLYQPTINTLFNLYIHAIDRMAKPGCSWYFPSSCRYVYGDPAKQATALAIRLCST